MSSVTTVYESLVERIVAVFPSHTRLTDAYSIEENMEQFLKIGWGLAIGPAVNSERFLSAKLSYERNFILTITRKFVARELDVETKAAAERLLMEDVYLITSDLTRDSTLNNATNHVKYIGDSGIEKVFVDKSQYLMSQIEIQSTIIESI